MFIIQQTVLLWLSAVLITMHIVMIGWPASMPMSFTVRSYALYIYIIHCSLDESAHLAAQISRTNEMMEIIAHGPLPQQVARLEKAICS